MPPRRRGRNARAASTPVADEDTVMDNTQDIVETPEKAPYDPLQDLWTDEQEISLLKGIVKWKPAGMHKHFRMISISQHLRKDGYDPRTHTHTQIPGIWKKLRELYNLEAIDEREDSFDFEYGEEDAFEEKYKEFTLPLDEYGFEMMRRGRDFDGSESPPIQERDPAELPTRKRKRADTAGSRARASTVEDTDDGRGSPAASPVPVKVRSGRRGRSSGINVRESSGTRASRGTTIEETEEDEDEDAGEDGDDNEDEADEDEEEEDEDGTPSPKVSRGRPKGSKSTNKRAPSKPRKSTRRR